MQLNRLIPIFLLLALHTPASGAATVIYDNNATVEEGFRSDADVPNLSADNFVLQAGANTITDVHWTGFYFPFDSPGTDAFTIQFFSDDGGVPSLDPLATYAVGSGVNRTDTGIDFIFNGTSYDLFTYSVDISPLTLNSNTAYWVSIFNNTSSDLDDTWYWALDFVTGGNGVFRSTGGWSAVGLPVEFDFQLTGRSAVVPEPSALALLGLGLAGLGFARRRRRL